MSIVVLFFYVFLLFVVVRRVSFKSFRVRELFVLLLVIVFRRVGLIYGRGNTVELILMVNILES